jgi:hypothetical protein
VPPFVAGKNKIINGDFGIWQRGTSFAAPTTGSYTADRWNTSNAATGFTYSRQTASLTNFLYSFRVQRDSGGTATSFMGISQSVESNNSYIFADKIATLSFWAKAGENYSASSSNLSVRLYSGTGTDQKRIIGTSVFTGEASPISQTVTLTTSWQRFTLTSFPISSAATQIGVGFFATTAGTAGANDWFEITGVQLEAGSVATPFQTATGTIQGELAACQRYYWRFNMAGVSTFGVGSSTSVNGGRVTIPFPVVMRTSPTALEQSGTAGDYTITTAAGISACTSVPTFDTANVSVADTIFLSTGSLAVAGYVFRGRSANTNAYLGWSAEL